MTARAWGWVRHLRAGGTTPWAQWPEGPEGDAEPAGRVIPGAQQLELLRRLNQVGAPGPELATRVLEASAPGRGRPDLELVGAAHDSRFGARPVDPGDLSEDELVRVATLLLAEDLVALGPVPRRPDAVPRPWRRRYRLVGDPLLSDPVRRELIARGHGPRPGGVIVVLGTDLPTMLADFWTARCFAFGQGSLGLGAQGLGAHGVPSWPEWLESWRARQGVPTRIDLPGVARTWVQRRGSRQHVHVLTDPGQRPDVRELLGVRRLPAPVRPSAEAAELARRLSMALGLMVTPARRELLLTEGLMPRLPSTELSALSGPAGSSSATGSAAPPVVPDEHRDWVRQRGERMSRRLVRAGYAELPIGPGLEDGSSEADPSGGSGGSGDVLSLAMRMLLGDWKGPLEGKPVKW